jgi:hypothetical protein
MAELRNLYGALVELRDTGKTGRVSFYYSDDDGKLQSGHIVVEDGATCYLHLRGLAPEDALALLPGLRFAKVSTLPALATDHSGDVPLLGMATVLAGIDPETHAAPAPPPKAAPAPAHIPLPTMAAHPAGAPAAAPAKPHVFYSHVQMQKDALELLEPLFGTGAAKKVEEFARQSPPHQYPKDFLGKCRQQAAMMLGARKAEDLFAPLFDKLD